MKSFNSKECRISVGPKGRQSAIRASSSILPIRIFIVFFIVALISACVVENLTPDSEDARSDDSSNQNSDIPNTEEGKRPIASTTTSTTTIGHKFQIDVYALERLQNNLLRLRVGIINKSSDSFTLFDGLSEKGEANTASLISLIDTENQQRYLSYDQSDGKCFCSVLEKGNIESGETVEMWAIYPEPPPELKEMTITTPLTPPLLDIPISVSSESIENRGLGEAKILDLTLISDNLEDRTGRTESAEEISIILSSDVLFETNSAELNSEAQAILEQVATEINGAESEVISINGHADNTGTESVNIPLSQERAEAVESALSSMVHRSGVEFEAEGHGSSEPIADNDTEEGRERNRRVSVTFEK